MSALGIEEASGNEWIFEQRSNVVHVRVSHSESWAHGRDKTQGERLTAGPGISVQPSPTARVESWTSGEPAAIECDGAETTSQSS